MEYKVSTLKFFVSLLALVKTQRYERCDNGLGPCQSGQKYHPTLYICISCPEEEYFNKNNHSCLDCIPWSKPDTHRHQLEIARGNATHDVVLGCEPGYYDSGSKLIGCYPCGECAANEEKIANCTQNQNTQCQNKTTPPHTTTASGDEKSSKSAGNNAGRCRIASAWKAIVIAFILYAGF